MNFMETVIGGTIQPDGTLVPELANDLPQNLREFP